MKTTNLLTVEHLLGIILAETLIFAEIHGKLVHVILRISRRTSVQIPDETPFAYLAIFHRTALKSGSSPFQHYSTH